jgi:hypothetical protein
MRCWISLISTPGQGRAEIRTNPDLANGRGLGWIWQAPCLQKNKKTFLNDF